MYDWRDVGKLSAADAELMLNRCYTAFCWEATGAHGMDLPPSTPDTMSSGGFAGGLPDRHSSPPPPAVSAAAPAHRASRPEYVLGQLKAMKLAKPDFGLLSML